MPQYDVSEEIQKLFKIKQKQRQESKAYFQKYITNPHGYGTPFDPVLFRYQSLGNYKVEHYRPTPRNVFSALGMLFIPVGVTMLLFKYYKQTTEDDLRNGRISYEDRIFKSVNV